MFYSPASRDRPGAQGFVTASPGTVLHPSISFSGDRITGIFQPLGAGSHTFGVTTAGTERLRIDSSGLVTINNSITVNGNISGGGAAANDTIDLFAYFDAVGSSAFQPGHYVRLSGEASNLARVWAALDGNDRPFLGLANPAQSGLPDTTLYRESAGLWQIVSGSSLTSATGLHVYNTVNAAGIAPTNYERCVLDFTTAANSLTIGTQAGGTGTVRDIHFVTGTERLRIDSNGNVNIGMVGATVNAYNGTLPIFQIGTANASTAIFVDVRMYSNDTTAPTIASAKSRGTSIGSNVSVQSGDGLLSLTAAGYDATGTPVLQSAAKIRFQVDAAPTAGSVPGAILFQTAPSGGSLTERLRIDSIAHITAMASWFWQVQDATAYPIDSSLTNTAGPCGITTATRNNSTYNANFINYVNTAGPATVIFTKTRNTSNTTAPSSGTILQSGDQIMDLGSWASLGNGSWAQFCAELTTEVDGTPSTTSMPTRFVFYTTPAGSLSDVERLRIDSNGHVNIGNKGPLLTTLFGQTPKFQVSTAAADSNAPHGAFHTYQNNSDAPWLTFVKSRGTTAGAVGMLTSGDGLQYITAGGYDGTGALVQSSIIQVSTVATPWLRSASAAWTTSTNTITMASNNPGRFVSGMTVYDVTNNTKIGTVSTFNGTSLVLTANALAASSGSTDQLYFSFTGLIPARYDYFGQIYAQSFGYTATAAWTTSSTTITISGGADPWAALNGAYVYDTTNNQFIGKVSSVSAPVSGVATITLQAAALHASSGAADSIKITAYQTGLFNLFSVDESGSVNIGNASQTDLQNDGPGTFAVSDPQSGNNYFFVGNYNTGSGGTNRNIFLQLLNYNNDGYGEGIYLGYNRGTQASPSVVQNGDAVSWVSFQAYNGSSTSTVAQIQSNIDATFTSGTNAPGNLLFLTCPAGGSNTVRWTIDSSGNFINNSSGIFYLGNTLFSLRTTGDTNHGIIYNATRNGPEIRSFAGIVFKSGGNERMLIDQTSPGWTYFNINSNVGGTVPGASGLVSGTAMAIGWNATNAHRDAAFFNCDTTPASESFTFWQMTSTSAAVEVFSCGQYGAGVGGIGNGTVAGTNNVMTVRNGSTSSAFSGTTGRNSGIDIYMLSTGSGFLDSAVTNANNSDFKIRTYSNGYKDGIYIASSGQPQFPNAGSTTNAANCYLDGSRNVFQVTSSMRFKTAATPVPQSRLEAAFALDPIEYNSLCDGDNKDYRYVGLSAEEVAEIDPVLAYYDKDGRPLGVQYERVNLLKITALQQKYDREVGLLKQEIAELKARLH